MPPPKLPEDGFTGASAKHPTHLGDRTVAEGARGPPTSYVTDPRGPHKPSGFLQPRVQPPPPYLVPQPRIEGAFSPWQWASVT